MNAPFSGYAGSCNVAFYFRKDSADKNKAILVYAWILPASSVTTKWIRRDPSKKMVVIFGSFEAYQLSEFLIHLVAGCTFIEAAHKSSIPLSKECPDFIKQWTMQKSHYLHRPTCTYLTKTDHNIATDTFSSPSHKLISNVESLFCIRKEEILSNSETIEETCSQLTEDTGIDFLAQIGRIGNIEWYTLPSGNIRDISHVQFSTIVDREKQSCTQVKITISKEAPGEYLVNARCTNGKAIVCDTIYPATVTDTPIDLVFSASEQITTIKVTIWKKISDAWSLWHEKDNHLNRQMHLSLTIHVGGGVVESRGLDELKKHQKLLTRVDDVRKFSLSQPASSSIIGNNSLDPWRQTIYAASDKIKFLTPKKSNALFLPKDWNGRMEFFEWLKATPSRGANIKEIIIIDPFMEEEAVRFIPRFGNIGISYTLIANTKAAKDPDIRRACHFSKSMSAD